MTKVVSLALAAGALSVACGSTAEQFPEKQSAGPSVPAPTMLQPRRRLTVTLVRDYGEAAYRQCRIHVGIADEGVRGWTDLVCEHRRTPPEPLTARLEVSAAEDNRIKILLTGARLYDGDHIGCDSTSGDGIFERLMVDSSRGTVVLVTSCNRSFVDDPARRELLALLKDFENRLMKAALAAQRPAP